MDLDRDEVVLVGAAWFPIGSLAYRCQRLGYSIRNATEYL
jgi:hypothetical protein